MSDNLPTIVQPQTAPALATIFGVEPKVMMNYAIKISETLTRVLREKGLTQRFGQGEHVKVEGWELAGSLMGFTVAEMGCLEHSCGSFEAKVALQSLSTGRTLAVATGYCGTDEPSWRNKPKYARRGMAMTRAIGRVYRQNFAWLIKLAGFEPTPAEEMPELVADLLPSSRATATAPAPVVAAPPKQQIYSNDTASQHKLAEILKKKNLAPDLWDAVGAELKGKPWSKESIESAIDIVLGVASQI